MKLLSIDVGGTEIKSAIVDENYELSDWAYISTPQDSFEAFVNAIEGIYKPYKDVVDGVAVALPGFIDTENGICNSGGALTYNAGKELGKILNERLGCEVRLENDGKAAAMAELANGALKECSNAAVFIIGTAVGGGMIVDGKLVKGRSFTAGELSFLSVNIDDDENEEKGYGMMCNYCSTTSLLALYRKMSGYEGELNGRIFFEHYHAGEEVAIKVLRKFCHYVAVQAMNLGVLLNCEKVAIGGGISRQEVLVKTINEEMDRIGVNRLIEKNMTKNYMRPEIVNCHYFADANLIGAAYSYRVQMGMPV